MQIPPNTFKSGLRDDGAKIGLWLGLADPYAAEIVAGAGFDWLLLDGEHAPNDLRTLLSQLQSVAAYPVHAVVRPRTGDPALIKQLLDIGARNLLIPMIETAEQARDMVRAVRYPGRGIRGVGSAMARASRFNRAPDYLRTADDQICLLLQVESRTGLDNLEAIAGVEGVDGVFLGPADLSAALGHLGNPGHADVQQAIESAIGRILLAGGAPGILTADPELARRYITLGCRFVAVGTDVTVLVRGTDALVATFRNGSPPPAQVAGATY